MVPHIVPSWDFLQPLVMMVPLIELSKSAERITCPSRRGAGSPLASRRQRYATAHKARHNPTNLQFGDIELGYLDVRNVRLAVIDVRLELVPNLSPSIFCISSGSIGKCTLTRGVSVSRTVMPEESAAEFAGEFRAAPPSSVSTVRTPCVPTKNWRSSVMQNENDKAIDMKTMELKDAV